MSMGPIYNRDPATEPDFVSRVGHRRDQRSQTVAPDSSTPAINDALAEDRRDSQGNFYQSDENEHDADERPNIDELA